MNWPRARASINKTKVPEVLVFLCVCVVNINMLFFPWLIVLKHYTVKADLE